MLLRFGWPLQSVNCVASDGWMRPPVRGPHLRAVVNVLLPQSSDFIFVMRSVYDRMPPVQHLPWLPLQWRRLHTRPGPHCVLGQQRGKNISLPGLRSSEPSGFRRNAMICKFHAADHGVNARVGFVSAAGFCMFELWV